MSGRAGRMGELLSSNLIIEFCVFPRWSEPRKQSADDVPRLPLSPLPRCLDVHVLTLATPLL